MIKQPTNIDMVGTAIAREKQGRPKVARAYCQDCPIKESHRADFVWMNEKNEDVPVCSFGAQYNFEKAMRKKQIGS